MRRKHIAILAFLLVAFLTWVSIGHATRLTYEFSGVFDSGPLEGQTFNGLFQYDTKESANLQYDFCTVTVAGNTYEVPQSGISIGKSHHKNRVRALVSIDPTVLWELLIEFSKTIDLSKPLPLSDLTYSHLEYAESSSGDEASRGQLDEIYVVSELIVSQMLEFFDTYTQDGSLMPYSEGKEGEKQINALRNMIENAGDLIRDGKIKKACRQLEDISEKVDSQPNPPDFVKGKAVEELANMLEELMISLECR